jgi:hypothetical protein
MVAKSRGPRFPLGKVVGTPGALEALALAGNSAAEFLARHTRGDWGEVDAHDRKANDWSLDHEARILSAYTLSTGVKVWVITEADRSVTTVLLPEEY